MRGFFTAMVATLALAATLFAPPLIWIDLHIARQDGFVAMTAGLAQDREVQTALLSQTLQNIYERLSVPAEVGNALKGPIEAGFSAMLDHPQYPAVWREISRRSHELSVNDPAANANDTGRLNYDVSPLFHLLGQQNSGLLNNEALQPRQILLTFGTTEERALLVRLAKVAPWGWWIGGLGLVTAALALLAARRRSTVLIVLGGGGMVFALVWKALFAQLGHVVEEAAPRPIDMLAHKYFALAETDFDLWVVATLIISGGCFLGGVLTKLFQRLGRRTPSSGNTLGSASASRSSGQTA